MQRHIHNVLRLSVYAYSMHPNRKKNKRCITLLLKSTQDRECQSENAISISINRAAHNYSIEFSMMVSMQLRSCDFSASFHCCCGCHYRHRRAVYTLPWQRSMHTSWQSGNRVHYLIQLDPNISFIFLIINGS